MSRKRSRAPAHIIEKLRELDRVSSYVNARFGGPGEETLAAAVFRGKGGIKVDAYIKEETRLHRESWILPLLSELLDWAEGTDRAMSVSERDICDRYGIEWGALRRQRG